ncbi:MAG: molybdopterin converting factor subunit 1 [Candidatus Latescibacteria bacterium]|nr:molybdopterin converting factor subunit 1 [Candidatus Latescibacterota bacterium]
MKVRVRFFALCRDIAGQENVLIDLPEVHEKGVTVKGLFEMLCQDHPKLRDLQERLAFAVNTDVVQAEHLLKEGDEVVFIPPVSGGLSSEGDTFRITDRPIRPDDLFDCVRADDDGAVVTFAGVVRNHSMGRQTIGLEYQAYPEMAEKTMRQIGREIRDRWGIDRMAIVHRIGRLNLGEISVLIAVAAAHRKEAFEACEYAIERLKAIVPIWKKEIWEGGGETWR